MLLYFGVGHLLVAVAQMSQLFDIYWFFYQADLFPPAFHSDILAR